MKRDELKSLRTKTQEELIKLAAEKRQGLAKLGAELSLGKHKNVKVVKNLRKELAKVLTILSEKKLEGGIAK